MKHRVNGRLIACRRNGAVNDFVSYILKFYGSVNFITALAETEICFTKSWNKKTNKIDTKTSEF